MAPRPAIFKLRQTEPVLILSAELRVSECVVPMGCAGA
jgi:hypothetical protein